MLTRRDLLAGAGAAAAVAALPAAAGAVAAAAPAPRMRVSFQFAQHFGEIVTIDGVPVIAWRDIAAVARIAEVDPIDCFFTIADPGEPE